MEEVWEGRKEVRKEVGKGRERDRKGRMQAGRNRQEMKAG